MKSTTSAEGYALRSSTSIYSKAWVGRPCFLTYIFETTLRWPLLQLTLSISTICSGLISSHFNFVSGFLALNSALSFSVDSSVTGLTSDSSSNRTRCCAPDFDLDLDFCSSFSGCCGGSHFLAGSFFCGFLRADLTSSLCHGFGYILLGGPGSMYLIIVRV